VVHELERHLGTLATIAEISPLLGLLGTVFGMIKMFGAVDAHGLGNPSTVAGGIAQALVTTAAGLIVAIPAVMFHRYFRRRVDDLVVCMEQDVLKMVDVLHGDGELK
jgi:biopolymer transport protein ExbB